MVARIATTQFSGDPFMSESKASSPMPIPKVRIAELQLNRALLLFMDEQDYVSAITLAGAAEGILDGLLRLEGKGDQVALDNWIDLCIAAGSLDETKAQRREFADILNWHRNELKHHDARRGEELEDEISVGRSDAVECLERAISNYIALTGNHSDLILRFQVEVDQD